LPYQFGWQATVIPQSLFPFHSPYAGPNSFKSRGETEVTTTATLFLGARLTRSSEIYLNPEWALGQGIGGGVGLGGYPNADLIGTSGLRTSPYIARLLVHWRTATGKGGSVQPMGRVIAAHIPAHRLVLLAGRFAVSDTFDANSYANNPRTQFIDKSLANNAAWDFAQDARGYTNGVALAWVNPAWALRLGTFQMPATAGGVHLAGDWPRSRGDQIEFDHSARLLPGKQPTIFRLLGYRNVADMGRYRTALAQARGSGNPPDVTVVRQQGAVKYGAGLNFEQPLADAGATGLFARWGWNDGATESFCYAEVDGTFTLGGQLSGAHWQRPQDRIGLGFAQDGLSAAHRDYLAAGGMGLALGDGQLRYGMERILEVYYAYQVSKLLALSLDYQAIQNLGFNRDRGPASVLSVRLHAEF
jgi:carbohydrate-selective porin OprB